MPGQQLSIGEVAAKTGTKVPTIRYYEEIALLAQADRSPGGHRLYTEEDMRRLIFIRKSRDLGFTLKAIRSLVDLAENRDRSCAAVDALASEHLEEVETKLDHLTAMRDALHDLLEQCSRETIVECRIIEALSGEAS